MVMMLNVRPEFPRVKRNTGAASSVLAGDPSAWRYGVLKRAIRLSNFCPSMPTPRCVVCCDRCGGSSMHRESGFYLYQ